MENWIYPALQGLAFWIGHRRSIYPHYNLGESAFVAELCNLIQAHLDSTHRLKCEVRFSEFLKGNDRPSILTERARADIVIDRLRKKGGKGKRTLVAEAVVELKRSQCSAAVIDKDLQRLAAVKESNPTLSAYLVVIGEASRPRRFVSENGTALGSFFRIKGTK